MKTGDREVREFFNQTGLYLHKRFGILLRRQIIKNLVSGYSFKNILDVGCGDGSLVLDFINEAEHISMIDLSENMLSLAKLNIESNFPAKKSFVEYHNLDFGSFDRTSQYDLILIVGVLAHVPDIELVFAKLNDLVTPEGTVIIQYSDSSNWLIRARRWWHNKKMNYTLNEINEKVIINLCSKYDLTIQSEIRFNFPFFGMKYFSDKTLYKLQYWLVGKKWISFLLSDVMIVINRSKTLNNY